MLDVSLCLGYGDVVSVCGFDQGLEGWGGVTSV